MPAAAIGRGKAPSYADAADIIIRSTDPADIAQELPLRTKLECS